jgi:hypothetical protein
MHDAGRNGVVLEPIMISCANSYWLGPFPLHPEGNKVDDSLRELITLPHLEKAAAGEHAHNCKSFESFRAFDMYVDRSGPNG